MISAAQATRLGVRQDLSFAEREKQREKERERETETQERERERHGGDV